jgi:hypothetical protein
VATPDAPLRREHRRQLPRRVKRHEAFAAASVFPSSEGWPAVQETGRPGRTGVEPLRCLRDPSACGYEGSAISPVLPNVSVWRCRPAITKIAPKPRGSRRAPSRPRSAGVGDAGETRRRPCDTRGIACCAQPGAAAMVRDDVRRRPLDEGELSRSPGRAAGRVELGGARRDGSSWERLVGLVARGRFLGGVHAAPMEQRGRVG